MKKLIAILSATLVVAIALPSCDQQPVKPVDPNAAPGVFTSTGRITVTRIDMFRDSVAYGDLRGVYIIKDNLTGTEYIGISGVGIAEAGSHRVHRTDSADER